MWRSSSVAVARRASVGKQRLGLRECGSNPHSSIQSRRSPPPHQVTLTLAFQNPRFFCHDPSSFATHEFHDSQTQSPISEINEDPLAFTDRDEIPASVSSEFQEAKDSSPSSSIFDKTGDAITMVGLAPDNDEAVVEHENIQEVDLEQLESCLSLLQSSVTADMSLESALENSGLTLNEEFVVAVLQTPLVPGENLMRFFKWASKKPELSVTKRTVDALVRAICGELRKGNAYALWDFVKEVGEKENDVLSTEILNELISLFSRLGKGKAGFEVFNKFGEFGCVPNADTYYFAIEALCRRSIFDLASSVCEEMLNAGILPQTQKIGKIIACLCKGGKAKDAHSVLLLAKEMDRYPPRSSANFLISSLCQEDETVHLALEMLEDFRGEERKRSIKPFSSVIRGLCRIKNVEGAKGLLFKMIGEGPPPGNAVFNMIINALSKAADMEEALKMMKVMEGRGLKPDVYTYSVIMSGYAKGGAMEEACKVLAEAKKRHTKLCPVTYHTLIRGYCKLEEFDKALKLLGEMKEYGVQPNADEYNKLIQSLCLKALDWETAEKLLEEMKKSGLHLNGITKGLIRAVKELEEDEVEIKESIVEA